MRVWTCMCIYVRRKGEVREEEEGVLSLIMCALRIKGCYWSCPSSTDSVCSDNTHTHTDIGLKEWCVRVCTCASVCGYIFSFWSQECVYQMPVSLCVPLCLCVSVCMCAFVHHLEACQLLS